MRIFFFADPDPGKNLHGDPVPDPRGSGKNDFLSFFFTFQMILNFQKKK